MIVHLAVRLYLDGNLVDDERMEIPSEDLKELVAPIARHHMRRVGAKQLFMIEIEFLDEPDELQRFLRFGTDTRGMIAPHPLALD